jgi:hypothetical protein
MAGKISDFDTVWKRRRNSPKFWPQGVGKKEMEYSE